MSVEDDRRLELFVTMPASTPLLLDYAIDESIRKTIEGIAFKAETQATKHSDSYRELHEGMRFTEANAQFAKAEAMRDFAAMLRGKLAK